MITDRIVSEWLFKTRKGDFWMNRMKRDRHVKVKHILSFCS